MNHHTLMDEVICKSLERWNQSEILANNLSEKV